MLHAQDTYPPIRSIGKSVLQPLRTIIRFIFRLRCFCWFWRIRNLVGLSHNIFWDQSLHFPLTSPAPKQGCDANHYRIGTNPFLLEGRIRFVQPDLYRVLPPKFQKLTYKSIGKFWTNIWQQAFFIPHKNLSKLSEKSKYCASTKIDITIKYITLWFFIFINHSVLKEACIREQQLLFSCKMQH